MSSANRIFLPLVLFACSAGLASDSSRSDLPYDSLAREVREAARKLTTPELQSRIERRRELQRRNYADVLFHTVRADGLWGALSALRSELQLEYTLPRNTLFYYIRPMRQAERDSLRAGFVTFSSPPTVVPLFEDRTFPEDPWSPR